MIPEPPPTPQEPSLPIRQSRFAVEIPASPGASVEEVDHLQIGRDRTLILVALPEESGWYSRGFAPSTEEMRRSQEGVEAYRKAFDAAAEQWQVQHWYPWRIWRQPGTGLPGMMRVWSPEPAPVSLDREEISEWAWNLLHGLPGLGQALTGRHDWMEFLDRQPRIVITGWADQVREGVRPRFHVRFGQYHGQWPVLGGQISLHVAGDDARMSVYASFLPEPRERAFAPRLDRAEATLLARLALQHHLEVEPEAFHGPVHLLGSDAWQMVEAPGDPRNGLAVIPFAGDYHLAYMVRLAQPPWPEEWLVFVDADRGVVLGRPQDQLHAIRIFGTSSSLASGQPDEEVDLEENPAAAFADIRRYDLVQDAWVDVDWSGLNTLDETDRLEVATVAVHAARAFSYLVGTCGADGDVLSDPSRRLEIRVGLPSVDGILRLGFAPGQRCITFQRDPDSGLVAEAGKVVHHPTRDPEVVYHEVIHGLMWQLNPDPFTAPPDIPPFARSLLEGYATALARSLAAARTEEPAGRPPASHWAMGAYPSTPWEWGDRWALFRGRDEPAADRLPLPNLYPWYQAQGLAVYDVGMVWARAMWDVRTVLGAIRPGQPDALALNAFLHVPGWVASFEPVAEALLNTLLQDSALAMDDLLAALFARRGIVAERGIRLAADGNQVLAVGDGGVRRSVDGGTSWSPAETGPAGELIRDGIGGGVAGSFACAVTEAAFYRWDGTNWQKENLPDGVVPLSVTQAADGSVFLGTARGVWRRDAGGGWQEYNPGGFATRFGGLALSVAVSPSRVWVAGFNALWTRLQTGNNPGWQRTRLQDENTDLVACVLAGSAEDTAWVGTGRAGIWQATAHDGEIVETQIARPEDLNGVGVLCLARHPNQPRCLYAGTTRGIWRGESRAGGTWQWQAVGDPSLTVVGLAGTPQGMVAGTVLHGLRRSDAEGTTWSPVHGLSDLTGPLPPLLAPGGAVTFPALPAQVTARGVVFVLTQSAGLHVVSPLGGTLWHLGSQVSRVVPGTPQPAGLYGYIAPGPGPITVAATMG